MADSQGGLQVNRRNANARKGLGHDLNGILGSKFASGDHNLKRDERTSGEGLTVPRAQAQKGMASQKTRRYDVATYYAERKRLHARIQVDGVTSFR